MTDLRDQRTVPIWEEFCARSACVGGSIDATLKVERNAELRSGGSDPTGRPWDVTVLSDLAKKAFIPGR